MNHQQLIVDSVRRILRDLCSKEIVDSAEAGHWPADLWQTLQDNGLTLAGISEASGGTGGEPADSLTVIREAAVVAAPLPLAETFIAARLCELVGATVPAGPLTIALQTLALAPDAGGYRLQGELVDVAFASWCSHVLLVAQENDQQYLCLLPLVGLTQATTLSMAGEPRSNLLIDIQLPVGAVFKAQVGGVDIDLVDELWCLGAATRAVMITGAMTSMLDMSVVYATQRQQFGRPIAQFQAIQQQLAVLAGEVAVCQRAADSLLQAISPMNRLDIAIARARIGEAVGPATEITHQVHGAMGYTMDHGLNLRSRRLWCWRDEYGNERHWQQRIGKQVVANGADQLWSLITDAS
ncbi:MAG: acyl-CoA dehydrogenase [Cyclobacteriaceae bacterium]|jgi:acyl-CoA dehydrogenase